MTRGSDGPRTHFAAIFHALKEVLLLITCATIAGCDDFDDITAWGEHHLDEAPAELMIDDLAGHGRDRDLAHEKLTRPELAILLVPCDRPLQALLPGQQWLPTEHAVDLRPIASVADDLSGTILDELNPIHPVVHELDHIAGNFDNRPMLAARDVESLTVNEFVRRL